MRAPHHPRQPERLAELSRYDILDTPREQDFDEIVALASKICDAPISLISLVDAERQWFKAEHGMGSRETALDVSICSHVILADDMVEIPDTLADPRTADNALVLDEKDPLRFYAGARLMSQNGLPIGTLCVLDTKPRNLTDLQREALGVLSRQVMRQLELRRALRDQDVLRAEVDHRVKNSLQSVASALRLFAGKLKDPESIEAFDAVRRRIEAVSAVHAQLQRKPQGSVIDMRAYLGDVARLLMESAPDGISVTAQIDDITLESEAANAIAMIASEFTANSIKHGFRDGRSGTIAIGLARDGADYLLLKCRDDGAGTDARPSTDSKTLGQRLMHAAASQLGGSLSLDIGADGTSLDLSFPYRAV